MAHQDAHLVQTCYSGTVNDKLNQAGKLHANLGGRAASVPGLTEALGQLREHACALDEQMRAMEMGQRCGQCAATPGGGCCSAFMAGNADAVQLLINLLMGIDVIHREQSGENCGFLGPQGCLFLVKPIFCLNYNCSHILTGSEPGQLAALYQRAAAVLRQQTEVEGLLLEELRKQWRSEASLDAPPRINRDNLNAS